MTLAPEMLGLHLRYLVELEGYPKEGWNQVGSAKTLEGAKWMAKSFAKTPSCTDTRITDREEPTNEQ